MRDDLHATALVISDAVGQTVALVALDLMYNDADFTRHIREFVRAQTGLRPDTISVNFSHSHNAPTAGLILGGGERDPNYSRLRRAEAGVQSSKPGHKRESARLFAGKGELTGMTFNRTRENGPTDNRVSVLRADSADGRPLAAALNFHSHCTAHLEADLRAVSRDWPGEVVDQIEAALPGVTAMYLQGTCGDVNFRREFNGTERRFEPARAVTRVALEALANARRVEGSGVAACSRTIALPTRRWTREEVLRDREEGLHRLATGDTTGWLGGIARVCVNQPERLPLRYGGSVEKAVAAIARFAVAWTDLIEAELDTRPETLETEIQALRVGDVWFAAHAQNCSRPSGWKFAHAGRATISSCWASATAASATCRTLTTSSAAATPPSNHQVHRQFPFTNASGPAMVTGLLDALACVVK